MYQKAEPSPLHELIAQTQIYQDIYEPQIFRLAESEDNFKFTELLRKQTNLQVFDTIIEQITELVKCLRPNIGLSPPAELTNAVAEKLAGVNVNEYGVWVYYPWSNKVVHLLDEHEFALVRTNRNKHKITEKEQAILATKKIGVMGLSVGQSVSVTLAMERGFGELRIADFDELDLSNINRIRTGVQNIKLRKTVIVAREIAEIDPFLKVVCYHDGITADNIQDFLTANGKLDLLIDECDSFDIKINARKIAKQLQIPVLMEGSDRGTIDIERFDLEPERPVLHGMVEHLDMDNFKNLKTFDEKVPYITAVTGVETLSPRMKASAAELMSTISTWPQLASAVTFGGGVSADLSRKILLNNLKISGRFFLDLDELIADEKEVSPTIARPKVILQPEEMENFIEINHLTNKIAPGIKLSHEHLEAIIEAIKLAPSGGNSQPWKWHYQNGLLHLFIDEHATLAYLDPECISSYISIGAAIENLILAAAQQNLWVNWQLTPQFLPKHIAVFSFAEGHLASPEEIKLAQQIPLRHTNRKSPAKQEVSGSDLSYLKKLVEETEGAKLKFIDDPKKIASLAEIAVQTDLLRMFIPEAHEDFTIREMRWTQQQVEETEDGIGIDTLDLNNNDLVGLRLLRDRRMVDFLQEINGGNALNKLLVQQFTAASAIGLITMPSSDVSAWINCGIASEKLWLAATGLSLQIHPVNVPLIFFYKNTVEKSIILPDQQKQKLVAAENELNAIFDKPENETAMFMFRIFKASASPKRTIRKSNNKIFSIGRA